MIQTPTILVTGGAGYIGAHVCKALAAAGYKPVAYDNLCNGHAELVQYGPLVQGDIQDAAALTKAIRQYTPQAVIHMAAHIAVGESVEQPLKYYENNTGGMLTLLEVMQRESLRNIVFSSTAAVYGNPAYTPIDEAHPLAPINPYGASKYMAERILADMAAAGALSYVALRYFNAAGSDPEGAIGCMQETPHNLIPLVMKVLAGRQKVLRIFGTDYPTPDGTAQRDYIHVTDLADAHVKALRYLENKGASLALNIGTGYGSSVAEVIAAAETVAGLPVPTERAPRRAGDPAILLANSMKAKTVLGWKPRYVALSDIIRTAWEWESRGKKALRNSARR